MARKQNRRGRVAILVVLTLGLTAHAWAQGSQGSYRDPRDFFGPRFQGGQDAPRPERSRREDAVRRWNEILLAANALDHTPVGPGENRLFGEQLGPHRTSRAFAIVHIAIFDTVNAIAGGHKSYTGLPPASRDISMHAAIAQAAHDTLVALYPSQKLSFDELLAEDLDQIRDRQAQRRGTALGSRAARSFLSSSTAASTYRIPGRASGARIPSPCNLSRSVPCGIGSNRSSCSPPASSSLRLPPLLTALRIWPRSTR